ncbi:flagellar hook-basal body complex protein FliE [Dyella acidiphila]|uniref:Flagellar hook-basal body complex protein FliE n=1 Tax=Dyella acidiphila TaxID=2775866 RepID=A0ABR9GFB3_9GAMM|nr:flagellar hook-basal body complex protein FliE [Dyella acidiphila]MBE1162736.1 flagellar hook-basal body complex protein FliE [Dyella acidiphila]
MNVMPVEGASAALDIKPIDLPETRMDETGQGSQPFIQMLGSQVSELNGSLAQADQAARALAAGENVPVHDVMIAMEHARLKLQMAVEVRNRIVDAYQNLTNMQL